METDEGKKPSGRRFGDAKEFHKRHFANAIPRIYCTA
jgi:hypothetical protein